MLREQGLKDIDFSSVLDGYTLAQLALMAAVISFLGFLLENAWLLITKGYVDNRNMTFPFLLGYGLLVVAMELLAGRPQTIAVNGQVLYNQSHFMGYLAYFTMAFFAVSIGEILLGTFVEKVFGFEYWNYTRLPLHITKYTSIPTSIGFALIITLFMGYCFVPIMNIISQIPDSTAEKVGFTLMTLMTADFIISFGRMYRLRTFNIRWKKQIRTTESAD